MICSGLVMYRLQRRSNIFKRSHDEDKISQQHLKQYVIYSPVLQTELAVVIGLEQSIVSARLDCVPLHHPADRHAHEMVYQADTTSDRSMSDQEGIVGRRLA